MSGENWPTALVSLNNSMTIGALKALRSEDELTFTTLTRSTK
jgi:DNA-binding LacI/PurR family transcriptional regulator